MSAATTLTWLPVLGGLALKSLLLFAVAGAALLAGRRASASARHLVCLLTLAALVALPVLSLALPGWRVAVLSAPAAFREPAVNEGGTHPAGGVGPPQRGGRGGWGAAVVLSSSPLPVGEGGEERAGRGSEAGGGPSAAPRPFPWAALLSALWLGGVLLAGLRPLLGLWGIARLSRDSRPVSDAPTLALASECASALGLTRTPALRRANAPVPMTWGWRRPVVLLPAGAPG